jgi:hypothetical protein
VAFTNNGLFGFGEPFVLRKENCTLKEEGMAVCEKELSESTKTRKNKYILFMVNLLPKIRQIETKSYDFSMNGKDLGQY